LGTGIVLHIFLERKLFHFSDKPTPEAIAADSVSKAT
jgi:hypothetical protein